MSRSFPQITVGATGPAGCGKSHHLANVRSLLSLFGYDVRYSSQDVLEISVPDAGIDAFPDVEGLARSLYEASRKHCKGRPAWEKLNQGDPYDRGMRNLALMQARRQILADLKDKHA